MHNFQTILSEFDDFLLGRGLSFEGTLIGGAALQLLGVVSRTTKDCDILEPLIPNPIIEAVQEFAKIKGLRSDWLNNGPQSLLRDLSFDWKDSRRTLFTGNALILYTLSKQDLLGSKLFAYLDRGIDLDDIVKLSPTLDEISILIPWLKDRDANSDWPEYVNIKIAELKEILYGNK